MARGKKRRNAKPEVRELDIASLKLSLPHIEVKRGVEYQVQSTSGSHADAGKSWSCPMCIVEISPGTIHTVAWDVHRGIETRRHFHQHCWRIFDGGLF